MTTNFLCRFITSLFVASMIFIWPSDAGEHARRGDCGYQLVERTIQVPEIVTERRLVNVTKWRPETQVRTVMMKKMIPEMKQVRDSYVDMVPHVETRIEKYQECIPQWRSVVQDVEVQVPKEEVRTGTRLVCRPVQVQQLCPITRCVGCCMVTELVPELIWQHEMVEELYETPVIVYYPEVRQQTVRVCYPMMQEKEREVQVTVCVPQKREVIRNVSTFRTVLEPQVQQCTVQVPYTAQVEVDVEVCRMVPKTVVCREPVR